MVQLSLTSSEMVNYLFFLHSPQLGITKQEMRFSLLSLCILWAKRFVVENSNALQPLSDFFFFNFTVSVTRDAQC